MCTPYAKWAHGVAERMNRTAKQILTTLCDDLSVPVNKWPRVIKVVQGAINRWPRMSRGGLSPLQLTTGTKPRTAAAVLRGHGVDFTQVDAAASASLDERTRQLTALLEEHWSLANLQRRHVQHQNRARTSARAVPDISIGDHVLYAVHKPETKLDYTWRGPGRVTAMPTPLICTVVPCTAHASKPFDAHISRVRRFAGKLLNMTEQLQQSINRDHPDNVVSKITSHQVHNGKLWFMCRWRGFTAEVDSPLEQTIVLEDCPAVLLAYIAHAKTVMTAELLALADEHFPTRTKADLTSLQASGLEDDPLLRNTPHRLERTRLDATAPDTWTEPPCLSDEDPLAHRALSDFSPEAAPDSDHDDGVATATVNTNPAAAAPLP